LRRARDAAGKQGGCRKAFALFRFHRRYRRCTDARGTMPKAVSGQRPRDLATRLAGALSARATA
jgi:hypothetical protein